MLLLRGLRMGGQARPLAVKGVATPGSGRYRVTAEVVAAIASSLALDEVLANIARRTAEVLELAECDVYDYHCGEDSATCLAFWTREPRPEDEEWLGASPAPESQPLLYRALRDRRAIEAQLDDPQLDRVKRAAMEHWDEKSCLYVPLTCREQVIGCLELVEKRVRRHFGTDERELIGTLAALAAVAIQNARLFGSVEHLAITDGLTDLYNHRYFYERLAQEVARARRYQLPLSLLMIDIDDFKSYNDAFGHRAGDALLHQVAILLKNQVRRGIDLVARYGGEEFAIILPSTGAEGAVAVGERLRGAVSDTRPLLREGGLPGSEETSFAFTDGDSAAALGLAERVRSAIAEETFGPASAPATITVSVGVASLPSHAESGDRLVEVADRSMYVAKEHGKNCIAMALEPVFA